MGCSDSQIGGGVVDVDTAKRVNYTLGMLLGVDDFVQESTYHNARRRELARELLGYGTAHGLVVAIEPQGDEGPRLRVSTGMAWLPSGTPVCVGSDQCCTLNAWLAAHQSEVEAALAQSASSPDAITLHVVLRYASCLTDNVPIPGEPCRAEDELMQPSRVTDSFRLELRTTAPRQCEEDAIRDFVDWITDIPIGTSSPPLTEATFVEQLREAAMAWLEPTSPPPQPADYMFGSAPAGTETSEDLLRVALRLWTTELRPLWMARYGCGYDDSLAGTAEDALLLATLGVPLVAVGGGWQVSDVATIGIDETQRPILLSLRMVQELITQNPIPAAGDTVRAETTYGLAPSAGASLRYAREDHTHGTPPVAPLGGDLSGPVSNAKIEKIQNKTVTAPSPANGQGLVFNGTAWTPQTVVLSIPALSGDFIGQLGGTGAQTPRIAKLQNNVVAAASPGSGQALVFDGTQWAPSAVVTTIPGLSGDLAGALGGTGTDTPRVAGLQGKSVATTAPANGQGLVFDGTQWAPSAVITALPALSGDLSGSLTGTTAATRPKVVAIQGRGVLTAAPSQGQALVFNGSSWAPTSLGGDLAGQLGVAAPAGAVTPPTVTGLQRRPVAATAPGTGQALIFNGAEWAPGNVSATGGNFVGRTGGEYEIVAAGDIVLTIANGAFSFPAQANYGALKATAGAIVAGNIQRAVITLNASAPKAATLPRYVVKLTPVLGVDAKAVFDLFLEEKNMVTVTGPDTIMFMVVLNASSQVSDGSFSFRFQVEVSRFVSGGV